MYQSLSPLIPADYNKDHEDHEYDDRNGEDNNDDYDVGWWLHAAGQYSHGRDDDEDDNFLEDDDKNNDRDGEVNDVDDGHLEAGLACFLQHNILGLQITVDQPEQPKNWRCFDKHWI